MRADVVIIDSGGANLASLKYAFDRLGARSTVSTDAAEVAVARRVVLPGVGAASDAMQRLQRNSLAECIRRLSQPLLGICLGMQLLYEHSEEGETTGLGVLPGVVTRIPTAPRRAVPHMGWNTCRPGADPLFDGITASDYFYFVHSYAAPVSDATTATFEYGSDYSAGVRHKNFWGVQFHPERSGPTGARLLQNFMDLSCS